MDLLAKYLKFCLVGGSGVLVDMGMLHVLHAPGWLGWDLSLSKALAAETALISNFVWNELWTFRSTAVPAGWRARLGRLARFNLICLAGIGWSVLLVNLFARGLGWNVYLANLGAIGLVSLWNFGLAWRWGWRLPTSQKPETPVSR